MKQQCKCLLFLAIILTFISCDKTDPPVDLVFNTDYIVFGHFFGECGGEQCVEIFQLNDEFLKEDTKDMYPSYTEFNELQFSIDLTSKRSEVVSLLDNFPMQLLDESETVFGSPDAGDWGGIYLEYRTANVHKFWLIDYVDNELSDYLIDYKNEIIEAIDKINQ